VLIGDLHEATRPNFECVARPKVTDFGAAEGCDVPSQQHSRSVVTTAVATSSSTAFTAGTFVVTGLEDFHLDAPLPPFSGGSEPRALTMASTEWRSFDFGGTGYFVRIGSGT
jgi:hypothetical protein